MLAHSPPLPLLIDYGSRDTATEDEDGIILAFKQRDRVRCVRLQLPITSLQRIIGTIEDEYPILEYLFIMHPDQDVSSILIFPEAFQAPRLGHIILNDFALPIGSRLLTTAVGLVTLFLYIDHPSSYFHPNTLLQWLSSMPNLETLVIFFSFPVHDHDEARQLTHTPISIPVMLPNLQRFTFQGVSTYLEAIVHLITTPRLEKFEVIFFHQPTFSVPRLLRSMNPTGNLKFDSVRFNFSRDNVCVAFFLGDNPEMFVVAILVECSDLDWQVSSVAQIFNFPSQMFSAVEHLSLDHGEHGLPTEEYELVDRAGWRGLLSPFSNAKTLRIDDKLVEELSRSLQLEDGEHSSELLPELQELRYSGRGDTGGDFTPFINARQNAGRPVKLGRLSLT